MKITTFVSGYSLNEQLTDHIDRHVRFALASVDVPIECVRVRILEHEPEGLVIDRGDPESACRIRVEFSAIEPLVVEETGECPSISTSRAAQRIAQLVSAHVALAEEPTALAKRTTASVA